MRRSHTPELLKTALPALLAGALLGVPAPVWAQSANDFQLPPGDSTRAQGPVVPGEAPPRVATPPSTSAPNPAPAPVRIEPAPVVPEATPTVTLPSPPASGRPRVTPQAAPGQVQPATPTPAATFNPLAQDRPPAAEPEEAEAAPAPELRAAPAWWPWAGGGLALAAIVGLAFIFLRKRGTQATQAPAIERPTLVRPTVTPPPPPPPEPAPEPAAPEPPTAAEGGLTIALEARAMTISFGAATLAYRITLTNDGSAPLGGVAIAGDMVSAHASLRMEEQLAGPEAQLAQQHEIKRIKPGESVAVEGEFRLPMEAIRAIRKGKAALFVPLARVRVQAAKGGDGALVRTALVGQLAARPGGGLQPFRLDLGPRVYREVTQKIFS